MTNIIKNAFNEIKKASDPTEDAAYNLGSLGLGQNFFGDMRIGSKTGGSLKLEGTQNRILVSDDSNDRILIGYQLNGF